MGGSINLLPTIGIATFIIFAAIGQGNAALDLQIAFVSERDWNKEIYAMDTDGNNPRNLTNHPAPDYQPSWFSPAGYPVSPAGKLRTTWGWLKQNSE